MARRTGALENSVRIFSGSNDLRTLKEALVAEGLLQQGGEGNRGVPLLEQPELGGVAEVGVDQGDLIAAAGERDGQVGGEGGFSLVGSGAGDHNDPPAVLLLVMLQPGAEGVDLFRIAHTDGGGGNQRRRRGRPAEQGAQGVPLPLVADQSQHGGVQQIARTVPGLDGLPQGPPRPESGRSSAARRQPRSRGTASARPAGWRASRDRGIADHLQYIGAGDILGQIREERLEADRHSSASWGCSAEMEILIKLVLGTAVEVMEPENEARAGSELRMAV